MTKPCFGCGKPVIWARTERGKLMPLDATAQCFEIEEKDGELYCRRVENTHVTHFATCPKASDFSGKSAKKKGGKA